VCKKSESDWEGSKSPACNECLDQCEAWCECQDYCEPLIKDAALCVEQGQRWGLTLYQNFNTFWNSFLTLFEISTTEGWVDVMYAAVDAKGTGAYYEQPTRDANVMWALIFTFWLFLSNMFFLNLSVGVIVEQFLTIKKEQKLVNSAGDPVKDDGMGRYFCGKAKEDLRDAEADKNDDSPQKIMSTTSPGVPSTTTLGLRRGPRCSADRQCAACSNFTPDPILSPKQAQWLASRQSLHKRLEPFPVTNLHEKGWMQREAFLLTAKPGRRGGNCFENVIMMAIVLNTFLMAAQHFPREIDWWDDFRFAAGLTFLTVFFIELCIKMVALRWQYWKDNWNVFDFFCVFATFLGTTLDLIGTGGGLGTVMSVIRIFRVARLFRLLRFMKGVNKIFMALVCSLPKLANVAAVLFLLLFLFSILGVQLFAKQKFGPTFNEQGNFQDFYRAFVTLSRSMTGEAFNEMMHDMSKTEWDFVTGPRIDDDKSWCAPPNLFDTEKSSSYNVLKDKCMIEYPNMCPESSFIPKIYFVIFWLCITCTLLNLFIAIILEGYDEGAENCEGEVIDTCIRVWWKYDTNLTMKIPFTDAFTYADEVLKIAKASGQAVERKGLTEWAREEEPPAIRKSPTGCFGMELASVPMKYAFDMPLTDDGQVHFLPLVKLVLRQLFTNNDPEALKELEATDALILPQVKQELDKNECKQLERNRIQLNYDDPGANLMCQVAACKIQRNFRARQARKKAHREIQRRFGSSDSLVVHSVVSTPALPRSPAEESDIQVQAAATWPSGGWRTAPATTVRQAGRDGIADVPDPPQLLSHTSPDIAALRQTTQSLQATLRDHDNVRNSLQQEKELLVRRILAQLAAP
jgi:hypothetical protein